MAFDKNKDAQQKKAKTTPRNLSDAVAEIRERRKKITIASILAVFVVAIIGTAMWFYSDRALPNTKVAAITVANKKRADIKTIIEKQRDELTVSFSHNGELTTATAKDLGITVDVDKTAQNVISSHRSGSILSRLQFWKTTNTPLAVSNDIGVFKDYAKNHFPDIVVDAKDAKLVYNEESQQFTVQAGQLGKGVDVKAFEGMLPKLAADPRNVVLNVSSTPVEPIIQESALTKLQQDVNMRLKLSVRFMYQGKLMYSLDPPDIAKWGNFTPDPTTGTVTVTYDKAKIKQFLQQDVSPVVAAPPADRKVLKNPTTGQEVVLQEGRTGRTIRDIDELVDAVAAAVTNNQALEREIAVTEAPFKTVTLSGYSDNWVEVDLSQQRTTLYTGSTPIRSFSISSGTASHPTVTGEFRVWYKNASQTMTGGSRASGDYYYLPGVTWVTYFYQDYSFHTAYWHNNFGHPMSHGCINMRQADAKVLYDFAPIGTRVVVHY